MNENLAITIFENGANALYQTINVNDGSCNDKELYDLLKDESVDYFISQIEKQIPKWIDVRDKMPPKIGSYICSKNNGFVTQLYYDCDFEFINQVTHWMPLPDAPILTIEK